MSDYSIYPKAIDGYAQIPLVIDKKSPINAESINRLRSGIINIEKAIGVAPEFSSEFGSFPDFASRVDNLEGSLLDLDGELKAEIFELFENLDIASFVEELSLTGLYEKDNAIRLDEEPLELEALDGSSLGFGFLDKNFGIISSTGIELKANGSFPGVGGVFPTWPRSIIINKSDSTPFPVIDEFDATLSTYLSFGGELPESDLAIVKIENAEGDSGRGIVALMAGLNSNVNNTADPTSLIVTCIETHRPQSEGGMIAIEAGGVNDELSSAGNVSLRSGRHRGIALDPNEPDHKVQRGYSEVSISGAGWYQEEGEPEPIFYSSAVSLVGSRSGDDNSQPSYPRGAKISCRGADSGAGGRIEIMGGAGIDGEIQNPPETDGGQVYIKGGAGHSGGDVIITSGESLGDGESSSNIDLRTPGGQGTIELYGETLLQGSLSLPTYTFHGNAQTPTMTVSRRDFTILVVADNDPTLVRLPDANICQGKIYNIKKVDGAELVTIQDISFVNNEGPYIDGCDFKFLINQYDMVTLQSDGNNWFIIGS